MASGSGRNGLALGAIQRLYERGTLSGMSEGQLLTRFVDGADAMAFEALVARHGPMVLGVCRRMLADTHDVEDAFQATWLILVRKGGSLRNREQLGPWLFGVAHRVAIRARKRTSQRRQREGAAVFVENATVAPDDAPERRELRALLDDELNRLPTRFRDPVVLCYLEGLTHEEAAAKLACPVGTVRSRMAWARDRLRTRLDRRGVGLPSLPPILPVVPPSLIEATVSAARPIAVGKTLAGVVPAGSVALANQVGVSMFLSKLKVAAAVVLLAGAVSGGAGVVAGSSGAGEQGPQQEQPLGGMSAQNEIRTLRNREAALQKRVSALEEQMAELKEMIQANKPSTEAAAGSGVGSTTNVPEPSPESGAMSNMMRGMSGMMAGGQAKPEATPSGGMANAMRMMGGVAAPQTNKQGANPAGGTMAPMMGRPNGDFAVTETGPLPIAPTGSGGNMAAGGNLAPAGSGNPQSPGNHYTAYTSMTPQVGIGQSATGLAATKSLSQRGSGAMGMSPRDATGPTGSPDAPQLKDFGRFKTATSREGDRVAARPLSNMGFWQTYRTAPGVKAQPYFDHYLALSLRGAEIPEAAVFHEGQWLPIKLEPPAKGELVPKRLGRVLVYLVADHVYSFNGSEWNMQTFELGDTKALKAVADLDGIQDAKYLYLYDEQKGRWEPFDRKDIQAPEKNQEKDKQPR